MSQEDLFYYAKRRQREIELVEQAASPEAASAHRLLAEIYLEEVRRLASRAGNRTETALWHDDDRRRL